MIPPTGRASRKATTTTATATATTAATVASVTATTTTTTTTTTGNNSVAPYTITLQLSPLYGQQRAKEVAKMVVAAKFVQPPKSRYTVKSSLSSRCYSEDIPSAASADEIELAGQLEGGSKPASSRSLASKQHAFRRLVSQSPDYMQVGAKFSEDQLILTDRQGALLATHQIDTAASVEPDSAHSAAGIADLAADEDDEEQIASQEEEETTRETGSSTRDEIEKTSSGESGSLKETALEADKGTEPNEKASIGGEEEEEEEEEKEEEEEEADGDVVGEECNARRLPIPSGIRAPPTSAVEQARPDNHKQQQQQQQ